MNNPSHLHYAASHEWLALEGETGTVGITDHAQHELSDVVFVQLPKIGSRIEAGASAAVVESVKAASDIYSPVGGEVVGVNTELETNPALVNTDPFGAGWIFKLRVSNPAEISALKNAADYEKSLGV